MDSGVKIRDNEEITNYKPFILFGRDIRKIPCFRDSFFYGICGGIAGGLISFMITSKPALSSHIGFACLWIGVFGYWIPCRIKAETNEIRVERLKKEMRNKVRSE